MKMSRILLRGVQRRPTTPGWARCFSSTDDAPAPAPATAPALPPFLDETLRGVGQVVFCNSPLSGGLILAGLAYGDLACGTAVAPLAALGATTATAVAKAPGALGLDDGFVGAGLAGYNGCLVGCAFAVFLGPVADAPLTIAAATVAGSAAATALSASLRAAVTSVPQARCVARA